MSTPTAGEPPQASRPIPEDVYPESGYRLPLPKREDLDDYGKSVYDRLGSPGRRKLAGLRGPSGIRMHSPKLAERANALSRYLRYESGLNGPDRELAILVTAREISPLSIILTALTIHSSPAFHKKTPPLSCRRRGTYVFYKHILSFFGFSEPI